MTIRKSRNFVIIQIVLALFLITGAFGAIPVQASTAEKVHEATSQESFLNPDGTLKLDKDFSGKVDLDGWNVKIDPQKGPVFTHTDYSSLSVSGATSGWGSMGGGVPMSFNGIVYAVIEINGNIVVGGSFTNLADDPAMDYIAKWDGTNWSALGSNGIGNGSLSSAVYALAMDGNGNLYAGGDFTNVNNTGTVLGAADYIAKWDGTNWSALGASGAGNGSLNSSVRTLTVDTNGDLYAGGYFTDVNNNGIVLSSADRIAKWDGINWSSLGSNGAGNGSLNSVVFSLLVDGGGNLYVGGWFTDINNNGVVLGAADGVAKWDGANWFALGSNGVGNGSLNSLVYTLTMDGNGNLYVGGRFTNVNNNGSTIPTADYIAKWDGTNWFALGSNGTGDGSLNNQVLTLAIDENGNLYVGGKFTNVNSNGTNLPAADYIAKWDGTNWSSLETNGVGSGSLNFYVNALATDENGNLYVGGEFTSIYNGVNFINAPYFGAWNESTSSWYFPTDGSLLGVANREIHAVVADGNGNVYVGGKFVNLNGIDAADYVAKWDGMHWSALGNNGTGGGSLFSPINNQTQVVAVNALALDENGNLYVGGWFTDVNNNGTTIPEADSIAKWDGTNWSALGGNDAGGGSLSGTVNALTVDGNGNLYVGGNFGNVNNFGIVLDAADFIARWDGTNWSFLGSNGSGNGSLNNYVYALAVKNGGDLYVGGSFTDVNDNGAVLGAADYIAKWDGMNWSALKSVGTNGPLNNIVTTLAMDSMGNLYAGGSFTDVNNNGYTLLAADYIAKWDGANWSALGNNGAGNGSLNNVAYALTVDGSGNLYVGGSFTNVNNSGVTLGAADQITKWNGTNWSALGSNGTGNGSLNDAVHALAMNNAGTLYTGGHFTDVNNNGTVLNYSDYIAAYEIDADAPIVNSFFATSSSTSLAIPIIAFTASDNVVVTGYQITTSVTPPTADATGWTASAPTTYTVVSSGSYSLYPWAKDAAGNVSSVYGSPANVIVDVVAPMVTSFTVPSSSNSLDIPVTVFSASDNIGVTSYLITEASTPPASSDSDWSGSAPNVHTVALDGSYTLYPWAKDGAGNVSLVYGLPASVTVDTTPPDVTIDSQPTDPSAGADASFTFFSTDSTATFECDLDGSGYASCSSPINYAILVNGSHTFSVRATDVFGNTGTADTYSWTILTYVSSEHINNGGFNIYPTSKSKIPTNWKAVNFSTTDGKITTVKQEGTASVRITGTGASKTLSQTLLLSGSTGDAFNFLFWVKGKSVPMAGVCRAQILFYNGTALNPVKKTINCVKGTYAFNQKTLTFTAPGDYTKIIVRFTYAKASGAVWLDAVSLMR